jgi:Putative auto-transporter adhesin, head GIN domain
MNKRRMALFAMAMIFTSGPTQAAEKSYLIGSFSELIVEGDMKVIIDNIRTPSAKASGDRAVLDALKIERFGTTVRVRIQDYEGKIDNAPRKLPLVINLGGRGIGTIAVDGSANVSINRIAVPSGTASLKLTGPGSIAVEELVSDRLSVSMGGNGTVVINGGKARAGQFGLNGMATLKAPLLALQQAKLTQAGNADTHLLVEQTVDISNSGAGTIRIDGKSTCFIRQAGAARITCNKGPTQ